MSSIDTSSSTSLLLTSLQAVLQSQVITTAFVIGLGVLLFVFFLLLTVGGTYAASFTWAGYESRYEDADDDEFEFDEYEIVDVALAQLGSLWSTLAALAAVVIGSVQAIANALTNNLLLLAVTLLAFTLVIIWDTFHPQLLQAYAEFYSCFVTPLIRAIIVTVVHTYALAWSIVPPLLNFVRQVWVSVTTLSLIDAVICAGQTTIDVLRSLTMAFASILLVLTEWLRVDGGRLSPLDVAPDFGPVMGNLSEAINRLPTFTDCLCEPISPVLITPFFAPFASPQFIAAGNATLALPFIFVSQGLIKPVVRSFENARNPAITDLADIVVRPSFESTFAAASTAVLSTGEVLDQLVGVAPYQVFNNIVSELGSLCQSQPPWSVDASCDTNQANGECGIDGLCRTPFVVVRGCCVQPSGVCSRALFEPVCDSLQGEFFGGTQCAEVPACEFSPSPDGPLQPALIFGCCVTNVFSPDGIDFCNDDLTEPECFERPDSVLFPSVACAEFAELNNLKCLDQQPLATVEAAQQACGSCAGGEFSECSCEQCLCRYSVDPTPALPDNDDELLALGSCQGGTVVDPETSNQQCRVEVPVNVEPPVPGFYTGLLHILVDAQLVQTPALIWNALFNIDRVLTTLDGYLLLRLDRITDSLSNGVDAIANLGNYVGDYVEALGVAIANSVDPQGLALSEHRLARQLTALSLDERSHLNEVFVTANQAIRVGFELIANVLRTPSNFVRQIFLFLIELLRFNADQITAFPYFTVRAVLEGGLPDVLRYAKVTWGDFPSNTAVRFDCFAPQADNNREFLFRAFVSDFDASTCAPRTEVLEYCRLVFTRVLAAEPGDPSAIANRPSYLSFDGITNPNINGAIEACFANVDRCRPDVRVVDDVGDVEDATGVDNGFEELYERGVDIIRTLDPLVAVFCEDCEEINMLFSSFIQPIVPIVLVPVDAIIHIANIFTTPYLACLDIEGVRNAVKDFVGISTNFVRLINEQITGEACRMGIAARDTRILCVAPQLLDGFVDIVVELLLRVWRVIQILVRAIEGEVPVAELTNLLTIDQFEPPIRDIVFGTLGVILQLLPRIVFCEGSIRPGVGCCVIRPFVGPQQCTTRLSEIECGVRAVLAAGTVIAFFDNELCSAVKGRQPDICTTSFGCCKFGQRTAGVAGALTTARKCEDDSSLQSCPFNNANTVSFQPDRVCDDTSGESCPVTTGPAQTVVADALGIFFSDVLLLIPRTAFGALQAFINIFVEDPANALGNFIRAIFEPVFEVISNFFFQLSRVFGCAGATELEDTFVVIASVVDTILDVGVELLESLVLFVVYFVLGLIEVITVGSSELLELAFGVLLQLVTALIFVIFPGVTCGLQKAGCDLLSADFLGATGLDDYDINFFTEECRIADCCDGLSFEQGSVSSCQPEDFEDDDSNGPRDPIAIRSCLDVFDPDNGINLCGANPPPAPTPAPQNRKRSAGNADPFARIISQELPNATRKRTTGNQPRPSAAFCGGYVAQLGEQAVRALAVNETLASQCLEAMLDTDAVRVDEQVGAALAERTQAAITTIVNIGHQTRRSWNRMAHTAREQAEHHQMMRNIVDRALQNMHKDPLPRHDINTLALRHHNHQLSRTPQHKMSVDERAKHAHVRRSVWRDHAPRIIRQAVVDTMQVAIHLHSAVTESAEHTKVYQFVAAHMGAEPAPHLVDRVHDHRADRKRSLAAVAERADSTLSRTEQVSVSMQLAASAARQHYARIGALFLERVRSTIKMDPIKTTTTTTTNALTVDQNTNATSGRMSAIALAVRQSAHRRKLMRYWRASPLAPSYEYRFVASDPRHQRAIARGRPLVDGVIEDMVGNRTLGLIGLDECSEDDQSVCTGCLILDNLIGETEKAADNLRDSFVLEFPRYSDRFLEAIDNSLANPLGSDTYTTCPKRTPYLWDRLLSVRWFWLWDYSELIEILESDRPSDSEPERFVNTTVAFQQDAEDRTGREDYDNDVLAIFGFIVRPVINALERVVASTQEGGSIDTIARLYERYVQCDYEKAMLCRSDLGIGLFDALMNIVVVLLLIVLIVGLLLPGVGSVLSMVIGGMMLLMLSYYVTLWVAYGASPLCITPSLIPIPIPFTPFSVSVIGIPTCLFSDLAVLISEAVPQCPPSIPIVLIRQDALEQASTTLCASCGTAPPLASCAEVANFLNGFDNLFYTTGALLPREFNEFIASTVGLILPSVGVVASLYTPEYIEALGEAGAVCNRVLLPNLITAFALLAIIVGLFATVATLIAFFLVSVFWLYWATLLAVNEMVLQMDKGFVNKTRVRRLKIKTE